MAVAAEKRKHIVIVGNVGTGKSTLLQSLQEYPGIETVAADDFFRTNPFFLLSKEDPRRWAFTNDLWFLLKRFELVRARLKRLESAHVVIDSGIFTSYVYGSAHAKGEHSMTQDEWMLFEAYFDDCCARLAAPDLVIFLDASPQTLRQRIEKRSRDYEVKSYFTYLDSVALGLHELRQKLAQRKIPTLTVATDDMTPLEVVEEVLRAIKR